MRAAAALDAASGRSATGFSAARTGPPPAIAKFLGRVLPALRGISTTPLMNSTRGGLTALRVRIAPSRDVPQPGHQVVKLSLEAFLHNATFLCGVPRR